MVSRAGALKYHSIAGNCEILYWYRNAQSEPETSDFKETPLYLVFFDVNRFWLKFMPKLRTK
jgi:hypothetical protein